MYDTDMLFIAHISVKLWNNILRWEKHIKSGSTLNMSYTSNYLCV